MKKSTVITGYLMALIFLLGIIFKIMHYKGAGILITVSCAGFALAYGTMLMFEKLKVATDSFQKFISFFVFLLILFIPASFLFKIMHWPYAGFLVYTAHLLLLIGIILFFINAIKSKEPLKKLNLHNETIILVFITFFSIYMFYTKTDKSILNSFNSLNKTVIAEMKFHENKSIELYTTLENAVKSNTAGKEYLDKATMIKNACDSFNLYITDLENLLITTSQETPGNADSFESIYEKANYGVVYKVLFNEQAKAKEFKDKLIAFRDMVAQNTNSRGKEIITQFFNTDDPAPENNDTLTWEEAKLQRMPLVAVLFSLNQTRASIRLLEAETMTYLQAVAATTRPTVVMEIKEKTK